MAKRNGLFTAANQRFALNVVRAGTIYFVCLVLSEFGLGRWEGVAGVLAGFLVWNGYSLIHDLRLIADALVLIDEEKNPHTLLAALSRVLQGTYGSKGTYRPGQLERITQALEKQRPSGTEHGDLVD